MSNEAEADAESKKSRSPNFPSIGLQRAVDLLGKLYAEEGEHSVPVALAAQHWGYGPKSSVWMQAVGALKYYGLVVDEGSREARKIKLSPLARRILLDKRPDSPERAKALAEAALNPALHARIWEHFEGKLPSPANLEHYLVFDLGLLEKPAKSLAGQFIGTVAYAGLGKDNGADGAQPPPAGDDAPPFEEPPPEFKPRGGSWAPKPPQDPQMRDFPITLPSLSVAYLRLPYPMSDGDFELLEVWLKAMKAKLTQPQPTASTALEGAS
ncbi:MAG: hypothetical protein IPK75_19035 [Acidobacteria bacterium]|nr:hypothetical protein [Acidobacteriota bacterium]